MGYGSKRQKARAERDPITDKTLAWNFKNIPEWLDANGHFDRAKWIPTNEPAPLDSFIFSPGALAVVMDVSRPMLEKALADPRVHTYRIPEDADNPIRATATNSGEWIGSIKSAEARAAQSNAGREFGTQNLNVWQKPPKNG